MLNVSNFFTLKTIFGTGRLFFYNFHHHRKQDQTDHWNRSPVRPGMTEHFDFKNPVLKISMDTQRPVSKLDVGFRDKRIYVYVLFQKCDPLRGGRTQVPMLEMLTLKAGKTWPPDPDLDMAGKEDAGPPDNGDGAGHIQFGYGLGIPDAVLNDYLGLNDSSDDDVYE